MNYYRSDEPWPHIIVDDYYELEKFAAMRAELAAFFRDKGSLERQVYTTTNTDFLKNFPITLDCLNSKDPLEYLELFPNRREHNNLNLYHEVSFIADEFEYPIHCEAENKVISIVTYVAPSKSRGTLLYDKEKNFVKEVEWKSNRTLVFAGMTAVSWHNYKADSKAPRITINTFLTR
jgi:hypothetical protein